MNIKDLQKQLIVQLGERLTDFGFGKKAKSQTFYRPFEGGWSCVHLSFIDHAEDFDVTVDVSIRFNKVEELVNSKNHILTKKEKEQTSTLGVELGNLSVGQQLRWGISSQDQVSSVIDSILDAFKTYGEPYLKKYCSLKNVFELLSSDDKSVWIHCPFHATRAKKAVAIAKLLNHPDIKTQILVKKQFLENMKDFGLQDFVIFSDSL